DPALEHRPRDRRAGARVPRPWRALPGPHPRTEDPVKSAKKSGRARASATRARAPHALHHALKREQVVILCGGQGTRMREETEFRPKALVEVGGKPVLWHLMRHYYHFGYRRFVLCLGYRGSMIKQYFLDYRWMNDDFTLRFG